MRWPSLGVLLLLPACTTPIVIRDAGRADSPSTDVPAALDGGADAPTDALALDGGPDDDVTTSDAGPRACGGRTGVSCDPTEVCVYGIADFCGAADATGVCEPRPEMCTRVLAPVCGCDGVTYDNECEARRAGTSARTEDACVIQCDPEEATCSLPRPTCMFGVTTASVVDGCWGPCVPMETCQCEVRADCPNEADRCNLATMRCDPR